jgi:Heparinase II/III-like protein
MTSAKRLVADRSARRRTRAEAGITLLHTTGHDQLPEICCRCDGGPHGSLRIGTRAYAEVLSVEVRYGGVDILAEPGTYCYHGDPSWRSYFRSMIPRDTGGIDGRPQSIDRRRFTWPLHSHAKKAEVIDHGDVADWTAEHDGYLWLDAPVRHRRSVLLDRASRIVDIVDQIDGDNHDICPAFHFGPEIQVELENFCAFLSWPGSATPGSARLELPLGLSWSLHRADIDTVLGGYSHGLGRQLPAVTLLGRGRCVAGAPLAARLEFDDAESLPKVSFLQAVSWSASGTCRGKEQGTQAEAR